jgi:KDO2-lipid IV(A) lauroyltransferase
MPLKTGTKPKKTMNSDPVRMRKRIKRYLVYALARCLIAAWCLLPLNFALLLGRGLGRVAFYVAGPPRRRAITQMMSALMIDKAEAQSKTKNLFEHCGMLAVELAMLPRLHNHLIEYVQLDQEDELALAKALSNEKGAIVVSAHLGNWELLAQRFVVAGFGCSTLARLNPNPYLGRWIVEQRARFGLDVIDRSDAAAARRVLTAFKKNHLVGFLIDQDTKVASVHVPFFGRMASTPTGAAQFALRKGVPVFAVFAHRQARGHRLTVTQILTDVLPEADEQARIRALTAEMTKHIEAAVRDHPDQWMWFHERWKTIDVAVSAANG